MPATTQRDVGEHFLNLAAKLIRFGENKPEQPTETFVSQLTPTEILESVFPKALIDTPYAHFRITNEPDRTVWFIHPDANSPQLQRHVLREAALGMMDNPYFR